jgi:hypothetical protein
MRHLADHLPDSYLNASKESMIDKKVAPPPFVHEPAAGLTHNVLGVSRLYKATGAETAGAFSLWEAVVQPEAFHVLSGEPPIEVEGEPGPGASRLAGSFSAFAALTGCLPNLRRPREPVCRNSQSSRPSPKNMARASSRQLG